MTTETTLRGASSPRRVVLADGTYESIKGLILEHEIPPGEHIGIDDLARRLSVSQTPVREALARLEADGLVAKMPLRGYETTPLLSVQEFDNLFQFRSLIEPWAAHEASRRCTRLDLEAIEAELQTAEEISRSDVASIYPELVDHDTRFHILIARAAGNGFVEDAFIRTHCHMHLLRVYKATINIREQEAAEGRFVQNMFSEYYRGGERPLAIEEHARIAAAIAANDSAEAEELMLRHIDSSRRRFIPVVEALTASSGSAL